MSLESAVRSVRDLDSLLALLREELGWPLPEEREFDELTFEWSANELRVSESASQRLADGTIYQLRPFHPQQPWGIFFVIFNHSRISITTLRQILRSLVSRQRQRAHLPTWNLENLLFICTTRDYDRFTFAHFRGERAQRAVLTTFGWERGETALRTLCEYNLKALHFPDDPSNAESWLKQWQSAFDVQAVTKRFFQEIANWYFWACQYVFFPMPESETNREAYVSQSLIRLITRLIFCWFVKQMGLIPSELFDLRTLSSLLKNGANLPNSKQTTFYKAILQNLFFATLNQEIGKRQFRKRNKDPRGRDPHRGITNLYRYEDLFTDPKEFLRLVERIPFLNGGLFECLDQVYRAEENRPDVRIDGFSDHPKNPLSVPDFLFFGEERTVDLSKAYGQAKYRRATVRGLIHIFNRYNFTVTESTPLDQEVALDPELAGKVFENLLAAYNPETATTARKATGSYYTPREIVDYMVDESLIAYLATKLNNTDKDDTEKRLRHLLSYTDEPHQFSPDEVKMLIAAIDNLKALDPACGSGAFPMGLLHKLVHILRKLDPRNEQWKERQIARVREAIAAAEKIEDATIRERTLKDLEHQIASIEDAFARGELDYGRKLYLIENCIYGVDIQPIAVQIAKMRFFISLTVDQKIDPSAPNLGIRPLPNLETKFVAANTLIGIERPAQAVLRNPQVDAKEAELRQVRERHFTARTPATKARLRELDAKIRAEISELLRKDGFPRETTEKLANWNPYDQNASADFFDPEWMFGIRTGFDIVIGNPPYVVSKDKKLREIFAESVFGRPNLYGFFIHACIERLLSAQGILAFINPRTLLSDAYTSALRRFILKHSSVHLILNIIDRRNVFEAVLQSCIVSMFSKNRELTTVRVKNVETKDQIVNQETLIIPKTDFVFGSMDNPIFIVAESPIIYGLFKRLAVLPTFSRCGLSFTTGKIQWDLFADVLGARPTRNSIRLIWAENIQRFYFAECRLRADKQFITAPIRQYEPIRHKTIIVQRTTAIEQPFRIIATIVDPTSFGMPILSENHTSYLEANTQSIPLEFVLAVLNSKFLDFVFRYLNSNTQVSAGELNSLPFPADVPPEKQQPMIVLVDKILAAKRADPAADTSALEREIDQHVYRLYGLTPEEIKIVEEG